MRIKAEFDGNTGTRSGGAKPLSVLFISTSYPSSDTDWSGAFIYRLVAALAARKDLQLHLWAPPGPRPPGVVEACTPGEAAWLSQLTQAGGIAQQVRRGWRGLPYVFGLLWRLWRVYRRHGHVDVAHVNWLQNALPLVGTRLPAVVSVLGTDYALLQLHPVAAALRQVVRQRRTTITPNAPWMVPMVKRKFRDAGADVHCLPFGVDGAWLSLQRDRLPDSKRIWLVVLRVTAAKIGPLFDWGQAIRNSGDELHLFGPRQEDVAIPDWVQYHGPTHPEALITTWFPQAAGLITLSRHDEGRPQVVLEAMAAGLPVIASRLPAHNELIMHGETGFLVDNFESFEEAYRHVSRADENLRIGNKARAWIRQEIGSWDDCAERYVRQYREILAPA